MGTCSSSNNGETEHLKPKVRVRRKKLSITTITDDFQLNKTAAVCESGEISIIKPASELSETDSSNIFNSVDLSSKSTRELKVKKVVKSAEIQVPPSSHFGMQKRRIKRK